MIISLFRSFWSGKLFKIRENKGKWIARIKEKCNWTKVWQPKFVKSRCPRKLWPHWYMLHIKHLELIVIHNFWKALKAKNIRTLSKKRGKIQKPSDIRLVILLWMIRNTIWHCCERLLKVRSFKLRTMCEAHKLLVMMKLLVLVHSRFSHCTNWLIIVHEVSLCFLKNYDTSKCFPISTLVLQYIVSYKSPGLNLTSL